MQRKIDIVKTRTKSRWRRLIELIAVAMFFIFHYNAVIVYEKYPQYLFYPEVCRYIRNYLLR